MTITRTFVALALPGVVKRTIAEFRRAPPDSPPGLRWGPIEQAHLTLVFLGDLGASELAATRRHAAAVAAATLPFGASLDGVGAFPDPGRARIVWVGWGDGAGSVTTLQSALVAALGRPADDRRPFAPHVTIARARAAVDARAWLGAALPWSSPAWRVDALDVMASVLTPAGAVHTLVERCPFRAT